MKLISRLLILLAIVVASCDSAPGPVPAEQRPPTLDGFAYAPQRVVYALLDDSAIVGDSIRVTVDMAVTAQGADAPIDRVEYTVFSSDLEILATGTLDLSSGSRYTGAAALTLSALDVQTYTLLVYAVDTTERLSGEARGTITYVRVFEAGTAPVLEALDIPDTLERPAAGEPARSLSFIAQVSDADGLTDVELVEFWNASSPGSRFVMCDDGNRRPCGSSDESGDQTAGDGWFTRRVFITSDNALGANTFEFQAVDRAGLRSNVLQHTVVIVE